MTDKKLAIPPEATQENTQETLLEFPCEFLIKVMGETSADFSNLMLEVIAVHAPSFDAKKIEMRGSSSGKYVSLTCAVYVESKPQLDAIYRALSAHPLVKFAL